MRRSLSTALLFLFLCGISLSSTRSPVLEEIRLIWREDDPLEWSDFHGPPEPEQGVDALSSCGLICDPALSRNGMLRFDVNAYFSPTDSWVDRPDASRLLLHHEQGHFDIGEIYARKMRQRLARTAFDRSRLNEQITIIYQETFEEYREAQATYDRVSGHSTNTAGQREWDRWIDRELERYEAYRGRIVQAAWAR